MSIHHTKVHAQITAAHTILSDLVDRLPRAVHSANLAVIDPVQSDRPRAEDAGVRSKGDHTDPTADTAIGRTVRRDNILSDLGGQMASLALTLSLLVDFTNRWSPRDTVGGDYRRCGAHTPRPDTVADWFDATCERPAMGRGGAGAWHWDSHGLCEACYQRRRRHLKAIEQVA